MDAARITRLSAVAGTLVWIAWQLLADPFPPAVLLALSPLVLFPLLLRPLLESSLAADLPSLSSNSGLLPALAFAQFPCAILLPLGLHLPPGAVGTIAVLPWVGWVGLLAVEALRRLHRWVADRSSVTWRSGELAVIAGLGFPVIGGGWLVLDRLGVQPFGFSPLIVLLTAIHFHHAGFTLPLAAGFLTRVQPNGPSRLAALTIVGSVPLVAIGITWSPIVELVGAWLTAGAGIVVAIGLLARAVEVPGVAALLFAVSGACLMGGMVFAGSYSLGEFYGVPWPDIMAMVELHGVVNALGFGLLGAWAWHLAPPPARWAGTP